MRRSIFVIAEAIANAEDKIATLKEQLVEAFYAGDFQRMHDLKDELFHARTTLRSIKSL